MKLITIALIAFVASAQAQTKPKERITYDTVKSVERHVSYAPDTIPVWFKEIVITHHGSGLRQDGMKPDPAMDTAVEKLTPGFIIWQTYKKQNYASLTLSGATWSSGTSLSDYYEEPYKDNSIPGKFLYADYKPVTNKIIYAVKR